MSRSHSTVSRGSLELRGNEFAEAALSVPSSADAIGQSCYLRTFMCNTVFGLATGTVECSRIVQVHPALLNAMS